MSAGEEGPGGNRGEITDSNLEELARTLEYLAGQEQALLNIASLIELRLAELNDEKGVIDDRITSLLNSTVITPPEADVSNIRRTRIDTSSSVHELILPRRFEALRTLLIRHYGKGISVGELFALEDDELLSVPSFGRGKLKLTRELEEYLLSEAAPGVVFSIAGEEQWPAKEQLADLMVNYAVLDEPQMKLIEKLARKLRIPLMQINAAHVVYGFDPEDMERRVSGRALREVQRELQQSIQDEMDRYINKSDDELKSLTSAGGLLSYAGYLPFVPGELATIIDRDLSVYLRNTDERTRFILKSRFGLDGSEIMTLQAIGDALPEQVTRERIRQLQIAAGEKLMSSLSVHENNIWTNIRENLVHEIDALYPDLSKRFTEKKGFVRFLELICQVDKGELEPLLNPVCDPKFIYTLAETNKAPFDRALVLDVIYEAYGYSEQQANNAIDKLIADHSLHVVDDALNPVALSKHQAVAQAAIYFPDGAPFREIHALANKQGFCDSVLPLDRLDHGIDTAVEKGLIYQSGHGTYRHCNYLQLERDLIDLVLMEVHSLLEGSSEGAAQSLNLRVDVFEKLSIEMDYFELRHIVRENGLEEGIYFSGKSGADTVSLEEDFELKGQKEAIVQLFEKDPGPRTRDDIAAIIRSQSCGHASYYINELMEEGRLVRVSHLQYDLTHVAFSEAPVSQIMERAETIMRKAKRPVEVGIIAEDCNTRLHLQYPKAWYLSLLRLHAKQYSKQWHFFHVLISLEPLNGISLASCISDLLNLGCSDKDLADRVYAEILVGEYELSNAISTAKSLNKQGADKLTG